MKRRRRAAALFAAARNFHRDHCINHAAAVSYFALLSLFPLAILTLHYAAALFGRASLGDWAPDALARLAELDPRLAGSSQGAPIAEGLFGPLLITMIVSASLVFGALERATRQIFPAPASRGFLRTRLLTILMAGSCVVLLVMLFALHQALRALARYSEPLAEVLHSYPVRSLLLGSALPLVAAFGAFAVLYRVLPGVPVAWRAALEAAGTVVVGWEAMRYGFGVYMGLAWAYGVVYGPLASLVLLLIWIFLVACLFLLGAEFAAVRNGNRTPS